MRKLIELYLARYSKKIINTVELQHKVFAAFGEHADNHIHFAQAVHSLVQNGVLSPVVSRKKYGWNESLYEGYRYSKLALKQLEDGFPQTHPSFTILKQLHPLLSIDFYRNHVDQWHKDLVYIDAINRFLFEAEQRPPVYDVSVEQRSLVLFKNEKFLKMPEGKLLLNHLGLTYKDLNCVESYEPFLYEVMEVSDVNNLLIVETRDVYYLLKALFQQGARRFGDLTFHGLIYGEGDKIETSFPYIFTVKEWGGKVNRFYYFGDIEPKKLNILLYLIQNYRDVAIQPFVPLYETLLNLHISLAPSAKRNQRLDKYPETYMALELFPDHLKLQMSLLFVKNRYLPQIALRYEDLLERLGTLVNA